MDVMELFSRYKNDVYRLAVSYTRSEQEAEDVCQTVFLKLIEEERITPGKEKAWLMQVTANECRSLLRSAWWRRTVPMEDTLEAPQTEGSDTLRAVMALPPRYRVVIYLRYYEEYSTAEIAALLNTSVSTVTTRLSRGRDKLKAALKEA